MKEKVKLPTNYYHQKLLTLGQKVVKDEMVVYCHIYHFDCGCIRSYCVSPSLFTDREYFEPCKKHKYLKKETESDATN